MRMTGVFCSRLLLTITLMTGSSFANADECRQRLNQKMTIVVNSKAGGTPDTYMRALAEGLRQVSPLKPSVANHAQGSIAPILSLREGHDRNLRIGLVGQNLWSPQFNDRQSRIQINELIPLAAIDNGPQVWVAKKDAKISAYLSQEAVIATGTLADEVIAGGMVASALGLRFSFATGYENSSDRYASILRGETDINPASVFSAKRATKDGSLGVVLSLSDGANPAFPSAPFLTGKGGLAEQLKLSREQQDLAKDSITLSRNIFLVLASNRISPPMRRCLEEAVAQGFLSEAYRSRTRSAGADGTPLDALKSRELMDGIQAGHKRRQVAIDRIYQSHR
jgi:tripartite-type tricarboxylate transporter receptor subunit TctC